MTRGLLAMLAAATLAACVTDGGPTPGSGDEIAVTRMETAPGEFDVTVRSTAPATGANAVPLDPARARERAVAALAGACGGAGLVETSRVAFSTSHRAYRFRCASAPPAGGPVAPGTLAQHKLVAESKAAAPACKGEDAGPQLLGLRTLAPPRGGPLVHQVLLIDCYRATAARRWNAAAAGGAPLPFVPLDRSGGACSRMSWDGCGHRETFAVLISGAALRAGAERGLSLDLSSANGTRETLTLPAGALLPHLQALPGRTDG